MAWFGAAAEDGPSTARSGRSTARTGALADEDPDRLTNLDVISFMGGEDAAHVAHMQILHAKFPTMGDIRHELADTFGCLPEAMMMMYGGMEIVDEWLPSETIPGHTETIVVLPNDHREAILRHMKHGQGCDPKDIKLLPPDSTMVHSFGKTAPLAWRERFKKADIEMRVIPGAMKIGSDPKVDPMIDAQTGLSQKVFQLAVIVAVDTVRGCRWRNGNRRSLTCSICDTMSATCCSLKSMPR